MCSSSIASRQLHFVKLKRQAFGKASEKDEIEQLELALEEVLIAKVEASSETVSDEVEALEPVEPAIASEPAPRRRPRASAKTPRERRELHPGKPCPDSGGAMLVVG